MGISKKRVREFIANYLGGNDEEIAKEFAETFDESESREAEFALLEELGVVLAELRGKDPEEENAAATTAV